MEIAARQPVFSLSRMEWALLGAFAGLNVLDCALTVQLIGKGYLVLETNMIAKAIVTVLGPPHYQFGLLWAFKILVTMGFVVGLVLLAKTVPRARKLVFIIPVCAMGAVCLSNLWSLISLA